MQRDRKTHSLHYHRTVVLRQQCLALGGSGPHLLDCAGRHEDMAHIRPVHHRECTAFPYGYPIARHAASSAAGKPYSSATQSHDMPASPLDVVNDDGYFNSALPFEEVTESSALILLEALPRNYWSCLFLLHILSNPTGKTSLGGIIWPFTPQRPGKGCRKCCQNCRQHLEGEAQWQGASGKYELIPSTPPCRILYLGLRGSWGKARNQVAPVHNRDDIV